jgi:hypothetical protein
MDLEAPVGLRAALGSEAFCEAEAPLYPVLTCLTHYDMYSGSTHATDT